MDLVGSRQCFPFASLLTFDLSQEWLERSSIVYYNNSIPLLAQLVFRSFYLNPSCGPLNKDESRIYVRQLR